MHPVLPNLMYKFLSETARIGKCKNFILLFYLAYFSPRGIGTVRCRKISNWFPRIFKAGKKSIEFISISSYSLIWGKSESFPPPLEFENWKKSLKTPSSFSPHFLSPRISNLISNSGIDGWRASIFRLEYMTNARINQFGINGSPWKARQM